MRAKDQTSEPPAARIVDVLDDEFAGSETNRGNGYRNDCGIPAAARGPGIGVTGYNLPRLMSAMIERVAHAYAE